MHPFSNQYSIGKKENKKSVMKTDLSAFAIIKASKAHLGQHICTRIFIKVLSLVWFAMRVITTGRSTAHYKRLKKYTKEMKNVRSAVIISNSMQEILYILIYSIPAEQEQVQNKLLMRKPCQSHSTQGIPKLHNYFRSLTLDC